MADMDIRTGKTSNVSSTSARPIFLAQNAALQPPLSRLGKGPGLLLVVPEEYKAGNQKKTLDPEPCQKWAEEGFVVVEMKVGADEASSTSIWGAQDVCKKSVEALNNLSGCVVGGKIGVIGIQLLALFIECK
jgi:carboxymethylenebutenolidase